MLQKFNIGGFTPKEEIETRLNALRNKLKENNVSFAVIIQNVDLFYFTGTVQKGVLVVPAEEHPLFFVEKSLYRAGMESPLDITPIKKDKDVKKILTEKKILKGKGGMELDVVPVTLFERWKSILEYDNIVDISQLIKDIRLIKSEFELTQIIKSGEIISSVFKKAKEIIKEGMRELDIDAELQAESRRLGHHGYIRMRGFNQEMMNIYITHGFSGTITSFADVPISGVGISPAIAQGASTNIVQRGIPVMVDFGGAYNGYITDETRIYVIGEIKEKYKHAYDTAIEILENIISFAKEGTNAADIYLKAEEIARREKLEENFMGHGEGQVGFLGHGFGLEINEFPVFTPRHNIILKEGMTFAIEPKFIFPNEGAVGVEVDYIVRKDRLQRITDYPLEINYL